MRFRINLLDEDDSGTPKPQNTEPRYPRVELRRRDGRRLSVAADLENEIRNLRPLPQTDDPS